MNYRLLFIMSLLILGVGIGGILMLDTEEQPEVVQQVLQQQERTKDLVLTHGTLTRDIKKGELLQPQDYQLSTVNLTIKEGDDTPEKTPQMVFDLRAILDESGNGSLQGFLAKENLTKGSLIEPKQILSPNDDAFILASLDELTEVAYALPLGEKQSFLLTTLKSGSIISLYAELEEMSGGQMKNRLVKLVDNISVLRVEVQSDDEEKEEQKKSPKAGNLILKLAVEDLQKIYQLPTAANIIPLPATPDATENRGLLIRQLRGN